VVLGVAHPHNGRDTSEALTQSKEILLHRGNMPCVYRNTLVFMAPEARPSLLRVKDMFLQGGFLQGGRTGAIRTGDKRPSSLLSGPAVNLFGILRTNSCALS
jgi:hypothetical protein